MSAQQESGGQKTDRSHDREGDGQEYVDRSKIDFDPDDGLYTGTSVDGTSDIPGPHEQDENPSVEQADSKSEKQPDAAS